MKKAGQDVGEVSVVSLRPGGDRAEQVLAVLHLDEIDGIGLERAAQDILVEHHLGEQPLAAPLLEVDRGRLLVDAVVARQRHALGAGRRLDQVGDDAVAGEGRHVHPHGVARLETEAQEDRGREGEGAYVGEPQEAAGRLGDLADLLLVIADPGEEAARLGQRPGAEDRRAGHADVLGVDLGAAGGADRRAAAVGARHQRALGGRERYVDLLVDVVAVETAAGRRSPSAPAPRRSGSRSCGAPPRRCRRWCRRCGRAPRRSSRRARGGAPPPPAPRRGRSAAGGNRGGARRCRAPAAAPRRRARPRRGRRCRWCASRARW